MELLGADSGRLQRSALSPCSGAANQCHRRRWLDTHNTCVEYGTAPLGYSWSNTNTAALLASGATNDNLAPLGATLTVPNVPIGWNSNQLALTLTNAYGTNTTLVTVLVTANLTPTNILAGVTNGQLTLSWPLDHIGWVLQVQTNTLIPTNWVNVAGSASTNQVTTPVIPTNGAVFYRMIYP
jgi:hypothetical protein